MDDSIKPLRIGIVAGESSGDILGAGLIQALRQSYPNIVVEGIAGPRMIAAGCHPLFEMDSLSVMGLFEVIKKLRQILAIRRKLIQRFLVDPPDIFIGIDAPDFNLTVEKKLKKAGIPVVHYVSPSVWAWRPWRIKKIKRSVDMMLALLPFEEKFYQQHQVPVRFVGHPLADAIPFFSNQIRAREQLGLPQHETIIAILPGSRANEIKYMGKLLVKSALWLQKYHKNITFIAPMVNEKIRKQFAACLQKYAPQLPIQLFEGKSQQVLAASNGALLTSGTATLEAMLVKRPMVVAYRMSWLSYLVGKCLVNVPFIALPNILANKKLVPEYVQQAATIEHLGTAILNFIYNPQDVDYLIEEFTKLHQIMRRDADQQAAQAVLELCHLPVETHVRSTHAEFWSDDLLDSVLAADKKNKQTSDEQKSTS